MRRILCSALAALALLSAPAFADSLPDSPWAGGIPVLSQNRFTGANIIAGDHNYAQQSIQRFQPGPAAPLGARGLPPNGPPAGSNVALGANLIAGMNTVTRQDAIVRQGSRFAPGGLAGSSIATGLNMITGMNNAAAQSVLIDQR